MIIETKIIFQAGADTSKCNNEGKSVANLSKDSGVLVVLKKYKVIKDVNNGFNDDEYNQDDEDSDWKLKIVVKRL